MTARQVYLGIDFGTSNSSIAYVAADPRDASAKKIDVKTVRVQMDDEGNATTDRTPTVVSLNFDDRRSKCLSGKIVRKNRSYHAAIR